MKPANIIKGLKLAVQLAKWTDELSDIVEVLAVLVRVFCWRTYEEIRREKAGEKLNDIQDRVFALGKQLRENDKRKNLAKRTEYL